MEEAKNEEMCDLYSSPSIVRMMKSGRIRQAGHLQTWDMKYAYAVFFPRKVGREEQLED
jgi:hypothetical protein